MAGCRRLTDREIEKVRGILKLDRDKLMFMMGVRTGFRIQELLSLSIGDVTNSDGDVLSKVTVKRIAMKGRNRGRSVVLHPDVVSMLRSYTAGKDRGQALFTSARGGSITRFTAYHILKDAFGAAGLEGRTGTHCMRKSFAYNIYHRLGKDIHLTSKALGHVNGWGYSNTEAYLEINQDKIDKAIVS